MEKFNVYKRKDGRWEGGISRGKKANGKRDFKCFFAKTKEKVCEMMRDFRIKEAQKADCTKLFSTVFSEWYNIVKHNVKDSTAANYSMKATKHILPLCMPTQEPHLHGVSTAPRRINNRT